MCHFQLSQLLEAVGILVNFFASLMALVSVFVFGLVFLYTMGVIAISRYFRVAKGFSLTRDGTQIISVMRDLAQISRVRREWA